MRPLSLLSLLLVFLLAFDPSEGRGRRRGSGRGRAAKVAEAEEEEDKGTREGKSGCCHLLMP